jgi:hypothetical protein
MSLGVPLFVVTAKAGRTDALDQERTILGGMPRVAVDAICFVKGFVYHFAVCRRSGQFLVARRAELSTAHHEMFAPPPTVWIVALDTPSIDERRMHGTLEFSVRWETVVAPTA